jgi:2-keto-4-pentenoate hydratase/2-oxohepta-3-ene-1,7-dioic acid hydratase in catechol pathway
MKILCIGRNYVAHIEELKNEMPAEPVFFMKPDSSLLKGNQPFEIPSWSSNLHHEIELVMKICRTGKNIGRKHARRYFREVGLGIDFTARDVQNQLSSKGLPWEKAKGFDQSAVLGTAFLPLSTWGDPGSIPFRLDINGKTVQQGLSGLMIFDFEDIIVHLSKYVTLKPGDLVYTGTPAGVGAVHPGDHLEGYLGGEKLLDFRVL